MDKEREIVLWLLARALGGGESMLPTEFRPDEQAWQRVMELSWRQGVGAVVWDAVEQLPPTMQPPRNLRIRWAVYAERIAERYAHQLSVARDLSQLYARSGIRTYVLKGFGLSRYYPIPEHRECGDFDCYLCGAYDRGNVVARKAGAAVDESGYKHSHIEYKKLVVENHRYCMAVRGDRALLDLERQMQWLLIRDPAPDTLPDTRIAIPTPDFNALFLTQHALHHFLIEGIALRHICDWGLFLQHEACKIDRELFRSKSREHNMLRFADTMTILAAEKLGLSLPEAWNDCDRRFADRVLEDIFTNENKVYNRSQGKWRSRISKLRNMVRYGWKYEVIYQRNLFTVLLRHTFDKGV